MKKISRLLLLLVFCEVLTAAGCAGQPSANFKVEEFLIKQSDSRLSDIAISGDFVVWNEHYLASGESIESYRCLAMNLADKSEFIISNYFNVPRVSDGYAVWAIETKKAGYDIRGYDLDRKFEFPVCADPGNQFNPWISGNIILWFDQDRQQVRGINLKTHETLTFPSFGTAPEHISTFKFSQDTIAFADIDQIIAYNITNGSVKNIPTGGKYRDYVISGNLLVWDDVSRGRAGDLVAYDLATGKKTRLPETWSYSYDPAVSDNFIVWKDDRGAFSDDIYGYDMQSRTEFPVCTAPGDQNEPAISGNTVVWKDRREGIYKFMIYGARITRLNQNSK